VNALVPVSPARFASVSLLANGIVVGLLGQPGEQVQIALVNGASSLVEIHSVTIGVDGTATLSSGQ
jgi:hypothetical protein